MILIHRTRKKFRDYKEEEVQVIASKINQISFTCGVREPIDDMEAMFLSKFIFTEFRDFSITEVEEACEKYAALKLDFQESHYQSFTKDFIAKILNSYKKFRNKALKKYNDEIEKQKQEEPPTEEELKKIEAEFMEAVLYKPYKKALENGGYLKIDDKNARLLFGKMYKKGIIKPTEEEKNYFRMLALDELKKPVKTVLNKADQKAINQLIKKLDLHEKNPTDKNTELEIKEKSAALYFNHWINEKLNKGEEI